MRRLFVVLGVVLLAGLPALAQDYPKAEVFGGYSFLRSGINVPAGFQAQVAGNFSRHLGVVGDVAAHFKSGVTSIEYLGGIRFTGRGKRTTGFSHFLAGGATAFNGGSVNGFALGLGSGIDVNVGSKWAIRVIQADWIPIRVSGVWTTDNFRLGFGIVYRAGGGS